jgi:hypothetical protein
VYSMVTLSPFLGKSLPLPGERTSLLNSEAMILVLMDIICDGEWAEKVWLEECVERVVVVM